MVRPSRESYHGAGFNPDFRVVSRPRSGHGRLLAAPTETCRTGHQGRGPDRAGPGRGPAVGIGSAEGQRDLVLRPGGRVGGQGPARGGRQVLEDDRRDEEVGHLRALARGPGIAAEAGRGCRRAEEDPVPDLGAGLLLRDRVRATEGRWERGVKSPSS
jgi:hypothetical protein